MTTITPVELHHIELKRGWRGYRCRPVDQLLEAALDAVEDAEQPDTEADQQAA